MKTTYDESADALYVTLAASRGRLVTREAGPGIYLDFDRHKALVGIEVLDASHHYSKSTLATFESPVEWITLTEAARESADDGEPIKAVTLRALVASGVLEGRKVGKTWQVASHSLWNYLENRPKRGPRPSVPSARNQVRSRPIAPSGFRSRRQPTGR